MPVAAQVAPPAAPGIPSNPSPIGDTSAIAREAQGWLADLVRINTTNPPGNEQMAAMYIAGILNKEGIKPEILEVTPGRSAVVARLRSAVMADPSKALLLVAHVDVVGVDKSKWTVDPFGAVMKDGYLYGRGASIKILIAKHWDKFAAGFALNEGGEVLLKNGKVQYVAVQASEKVPVNVAVIARGTSGHASRPTKDNAVIHLASAIVKIGGYSAPVHFTTIARRYFEQLAAIEDDEIGKWMRSLDASDRGEHAQKVVSDANPLWNSMMRDTIAPTMLSAGVRANVIPGEARAILNIRLLPGDTVNMLLADLTKLVSDPQIRFEIQPDAGLAAPPSSLESDFYAAITRVAEREFSNAPVLPFQSTGATDSAQLRLHNVQAYGLLPFPLTDEDFRRMHGDDERIPLASFNKGVDLLARVLAEFAVAR